MRCVDRGQEEWEASTEGRISNEILSLGFYQRGQRERMEKVTGLTVNINQPPELHTL